MNTDLKIGLALGSGSSRGWAHLGIIDELAKIGISPDIVCGTSVGAMVGAAYVNGKIEQLEAWARSVTKLDVARFIEINTSFTGFVNSQRFHDYLNENVADDDDVIEELPKVYAAIATDLETGREVWLSHGSIIQAVWASMSLPGLFPAIKYNDRWLVDGGLVNPVPVSVCRALGADIVIAVNLNGDIVGKHQLRNRLGTQPNKHEIEKNHYNGLSRKLNHLVKEYTSYSLFDDEDTDSKKRSQPPGLLDAIASSVNITQDRITRSRMAGDPPDIVFSPRLADIGLLELYRADEAIAEGRRCVQGKMSELEHLLGLAEG